MKDITKDTTMTLTFQTKKELSELCLELDHSRLSETIDYLLYELNKTKEDNNENDTI